MGSHFCYETYTGTATVEAAYNELCRNAVSEYGTDPYNGTISTSNGYLVEGNDPLTIPEAEELAHSLSEGLQKWGPWIAIPLAETETKTVEVTVNARTDSVRDLEHLAAAKAPRGWVVTQTIVHSWTRTLRAPKVSPLPASKAAWMVTGPGVSSARTFATRAEAVAFAKALVVERTTTEGNGTLMLSTHDVGVRRVFVTDDGNPAEVRVTLPVAKVTATIELRLARKKGTKRAGWFFAGWAAS